MKRLVHGRLVECGTDVPARADGLRNLERRLEIAGWHVKEIDINVPDGRARIRITSFDGVDVTLDAQHGRASITRDFIGREEVAVGRRGDRSRVERIKPEFLGRTRYEGMRQALRGLADYIASNSRAPLDRADVRNWFRPMLNEASP